MKQLTCEMCGNTEIVKQDGVFVCQACGMKYSLDEAKKMMVEGTVDVQGTVKVDNSAFVEKYLANARRAKAKEDWEETEKYYNLVEQNAPNNIEAIFYSAYGKARRSLAENDIHKRQAAFKVLQNCVSIIDDHYSVEKENTEKEIIEQISSDITKMMCCDYVTASWESNSYTYSVTVANSKHINRKETERLFVSLMNEYIKSLTNIIAKYSEDEQCKVKWLYFEIIGLLEFVRDFKWQTMPLFNTNYSHLPDKSGMNQEIIKMHMRIKEFDHKHEVPVIAQAESRPTNSGCYVATCVYGSYDCPEVWTLRRYRDNTLGSTWYGRSFVHTYYAISPTLVKWFGHTNWFKRFWKSKLDRMVTKLQENGVESTPYKDKNW